MGFFKNINVVQLIIKDKPKTELAQKIPYIHVYINGNCK